MQTVKVNPGHHTYDIEIDNGNLVTLGARVKEIVNPSSVILISDSNVADIYGENALQSLQKENLIANLVTFPAGEKSKCNEQLCELHQRMFELHADRKSCVVALGGGVTGDLAGFAAATFMRGIRFVQVPTTLLSQVDSSSGGKTGINCSYGKNLIGAFHQPSFVLIDTDTLGTLPKKEFLSGMGEVIKHGVIRDAEYFNYIKDNAEGLLNLDAQILAETVAGSCKIKGEIVTEDEREAGVRALLNFGHTFAHAYETLSAYKWAHGEAVSVGMIAACRLAEKVLGISADVRTELTELLTSLQMRTTAEDFGTSEVIRIMRGDKKAEAGKMRFVLPTKIGAAKVVEVSDLKAIEEAVAETVG